MWKNGQERNIKTVCQIIKARCNPMQGQMNLAKNGRKNAFGFVLGMKDGWGKECTSCCCMRERRGVAWFRLGIWKLRGLRSGWKGEDAPCVGRKRMIFTFGIHGNAKVV
jgi:hypothetical protein